jgi:integrase
MSVLVKKVATNKWGVEINADGKQRRITVGTKAAAIELQTAIQSEIAQNKLGMLAPKRKPITFKSISADWLAEVKPTVKDSTYERYECVSRLHINPKLGSIDIRDITRADILKFLKGVKETGLSVSSVQLVGTVISSVMLYALDLEVIEKSPFQEIGRSLKMKKSVKYPDPFTHEQLASLLAASPERYRLYFLLLMRTGMRVGEALALEWDDLVGNSLTIKRTFSNGRLGSPKNGKQRTIQLSPQLLTEMQVHRKTEVESCLKAGVKPKLIFAEGGTYINYHALRNSWKRMLKSVGLGEYKMHFIRHSVASLLIDAGTSPTDVQALLGHHSPAFTLQIYSHALKKDEAITGCLDSLGSGKKAAGGI